MRRGGGGCARVRAADSRFLAGAGGRPHQPRPAAGVHDHVTVGQPARFAASVADGAGRVRGAGDLPEPQSKSRADAVGDSGDRRGDGVLRQHDGVRVVAVREGRRRHADGRPRPRPVVAEPLHGHPPADALSRLRIVCGAVCVRNGGAGHGSHRCPLAAVRAPLDADLVDGAWDRHAVGRPLGVCRDRLGRLLGVGPGRERGADAVARGHRVSAFRDGAGEEGHAQGVEHGAGVGHLCPRAVRDVSHAQRDRQFHPLVRAVVRRPVSARVHRAWCWCSPPP